MRDTHKNPVSLSARDASLEASPIGLLGGGALLLSLSVGLASISAPGDSRMPGGPEPIATRLLSHERLEEHEERETLRAPIDLSAVDARGFLDPHWWRNALMRGAPAPCR